MSLIKVALKLVGKVGNLSLVQAANKLKNIEKNYFDNGLKSVNKFIQNPHNNQVASRMSKLKPNKLSNIMAERILK